MAIFKKEKLRELLAAEPKPQHTVLLVDDEPNNLNVLKSILGNRYHILLANDGQEALDQVRTMSQPEQLALVITDQRMPRLTGVQLCEQLCRVAPDTMRIIVTGYIDVDAIVDSINRAHIFQFVIKPFDREEFELTVQQAIEAFQGKQKLNQHVRQMEGQVMQLQQQLQEMQSESAFPASAASPVSLLSPPASSRPGMPLPDFSPAQAASQAPVQG